MNNISNSLIDEKYLSETEDTDDFFNLDNQILDFSKKIENIDKSCVYGFIGSFGSGKSVFLKKVFNKLNISNNLIFFDAWKYPERKELREGFVLDFVKQTDKKSSKFFIRNLEGKQSEEFTEKLISLSSVVYSPLRNFNDFLQSSPARRIDDIENIFKEKLKEYTKGPYYIILEDIDRSGVDGIYFLETLKKFIDKYSDEFSSNFIFITPISDETLNNKDNFDHYIKIFDNYDFFRPNYDWKTFLRNFLIDVDEKIINILNNELNKKNKFFSIREIKFILRKINYRFKNNEYNPNIKYKGVYILIHFFFILNSTTKSREKNNNSFSEHDFFGIHSPQIYDKIDNSTYIYKGLLNHFNEYYTIKEGSGRISQINFKDELEDINLSDDLGNNSYIEIPSFYKY